MKYLPFIQCCFVRARLSYQLGLPQGVECAKKHQCTRVSLRFHLDNSTLINTVQLIKELNKSFLRIFPEYFLIALSFCRLFFQYPFLDFCIELYLIDLQDIPYEVLPECTYIAFEDIASRELGCNQLDWGSGYAVLGDSYV